jgi:hypothetical protein
MSGLFNNNNNNNNNIDDVKGSGVIAKFEWTWDNGTLESIVEDLAVPKVNTVSHIICSHIKQCK